MLPSDPPNKYDKILSTEELPDGVRALIRRACFKGNQVDGFIFYDRQDAINDGMPVVLGPIVNVENDIYETRHSKYIVEVIEHD